MSNANSSEKSFDPSSSELPLIQADWVSTSTDSDYSVSPTTATESALLHLETSQNLDYNSESLNATDAIAFNFFPTPSSGRSANSSVKTIPTPRNPFDVFLSPWALGGFCCLLLANGLLTLSALSPEQNVPSPSAVSIPDKTMPTNTGMLNLSQATPQSLNLATLSELSNPVAKKTDAIPAYQAVAALETPRLPPPPVASPVASVPQVPARSAPVVRDSLAELLLPPSLQPQTTYSVALPPAPPTIPRVAAQPIRKLAPIALKSQAPLPAPPQAAKLPAIAVPQRYTNPTPPQVITPTRPQLPSRQAVVLPPPPPATVNPPAPPQAAIAPQTIPNQGNVTANPAAMGQPPTASEQMLKQLLDQQNQLQSSQQQAQDFNQKVQQKLNNSSVPNRTTSIAEPATETKQLIDQLQQLNQPE